MKTLLLSLALLWTAPTVHAASADERLAENNTLAQDALVTVLHRQEDGVVLRFTGMWLEPGGDLLLVPLHRVLGGGSFAVLSGGRPAVRARLVVGDTLRRFAILQVKDLKAPADLPRISTRYPKVGEELPMLTAGGSPQGVMVTLSAETAVGVDLGEAEPPAGALLLDARGEAAAMAVPAIPGKDATFMPLVHAKELRSRARLTPGASRKTPDQALLTCLTKAALAEPGGRGCVDPTRVEAVVREAADAAEAVISAELGRKVDTMNRAGWTQQVLALLEGRGPVFPVDWAAEANPVDEPPGGLVSPWAFAQDERFFERGELRVDRERPFASFQEVQALGVRAASVVMVDDSSAWVRTAGTNLDGSRWAISRHWHSFAGGWALDVKPDDVALGALPSGWPEALDELPWLRDAVMKDMIVWLREQENPAEEAPETAP